MKILGLDPGLETVGFACLSNGQLGQFGVIKTASGDATELRLVEIEQDLCSLLDQFRPDLVAIEELFFVQNITNGIQVAQARGVMLAACARRGIRLLEMKPKQVKTAVCGSGAASKKQVQKAVQMIFKLPEPPQPDDAADAIAIAYWANQNKCTM